MNRASSKNNAGAVKYFKISYCFVILYGSDLYIVREIMRTEQNSSNVCYKEHLLSKIRNKLLCMMPSFLVHNSFYIDTVLKLQYWTQHIYENLNYACGYSVDNDFSE